MPLSTLLHGEESSVLLHVLYNLSVSLTASKHDHSIILEDLHSLQHNNFNSQRSKKVQTCPFLTIKMVAQENGIFLHILGNIPTRLYHPKLFRIFAILSIYFARSTCFVCEELTQARLCGRRLVIVFAGLMSLSAFRWPWSKWEYYAKHTNLKTMRCLQNDRCKT